MEKEKIVRISVAGLFAVAALTTISVLHPQQAKAKDPIEGKRYLASDLKCYPGGGCLPTVVVKP